MIVGIGTDIIEIERFEASIENKTFMNKYFTPNEIDFFNARKNKTHVIAGSFCAKEAVAKALGTGFVGFSPIDIEVLRVDNNGKPFVNLYNEAHNLSLDLGVKKVFVTISHSSTHAIAFAVLEGQTI